MKLKGFVKLEGLLETEPKLEPFWNRIKYPVPGYPESPNYPVLEPGTVASLGGRGLE